MIRRADFRAACSCLLALSSLFATSGTVAQEPRDTVRIDSITIASGSGSFVVAGGGGYEDRRITVHYHKPESFHRASQVMLVIPGAGRNGDDYRDAWVDASEKYGVLILSPSYPEEFYPEFWSYNLAGMTREVTLDLRFVIETRPDEWILDDVRQELQSTIGMHDLVGQSAAHQLIYQLVLFSKAGMLENVDVLGTSSVPSTNPDEWIFDDFDRIFEIVKAELGMEADDYDLFGHSAGGQILHRLALFHPNSRADRILAANSGWYTLPTVEQEFPYGLKGTGLDEHQLEAAFKTHLVVFLGEDDDADETRGSVRRTPEADRQGAHRLARGRFFFTEARKAADALDADFDWQLEIVPGVGHDYERMSEAAAEYLYGTQGSG